MPIYDNTDTDKVSASALEISSITADIKVDTHQDSYIEYAITGPADLIRDIDASVRGGTLVIEGGEASSYGSNMATSSDSFFISGISGYKSTSKGIDRTRKNIDMVQITVNVPQGTSVNVTYVQGDVVIGYTDGPLVASVLGSKVSAGRVTSAQLTVQGSGDIYVNEVNGMAIVQVQGSGDVNIERGSMPSLMGTVQGSGDIKVGGSAAMASLTIQGSGNIEVLHVRQRPTSTIMGTGDIKVKRIG